MKKNSYSSGILQTIIVLAMVVYAKDCCPRQCPTYSTQMCCKRCPATCSTVPAKMARLVVQPNKRYCTKTQIRWKPPKSCAPIKATETQCRGSNGFFTSLPRVPGAFTAWTLDATHFTKQPFKIKRGQYLVCRVRSKNRIGWSKWSPSNRPVKLPKCGGRKRRKQLAVQFRKNRWGMTQLNDGNCPCRSSCRATGCNGCCQHRSQGTFWSKVGRKAYCTTSTCTVVNKNLRDQLHRHRYCHVHLEDKNRKRIITKWEIQRVKRRQQVLRPVTKTVKRLVLQKQFKKQKQLRYETKTVKQKKILNQKVKQKITKISFIKVKKMRPVTKVIKKYRTIYKKVLRPVTEKVKSIKMVKRTVMRKQVQYEKREIKRRGVRYVTKEQEFSYKIPRMGMTQLAALPSEQRILEIERMAAKVRAKNMGLEIACPCFQGDCVCRGKENCECCFPKCSCAPKFNVLLPTQEYEIVLVNKTVTVPEDFITSITVEFPKLVDVPHIIIEPKEVFTDKVVWVTKLVEEKEEYFEPTVVEVEEEVEVPNETFVEIEVDVPQEIEVLVEKKIPISYMVPVEISVPVEVDAEVTEQRA